MKKLFSKFIKLALGSALIFSLLLAPMVTYDVGIEVTSIVTKPDNN